MAPGERDAEYDAANQASDLLGSLFKPLSDAELATCRRIHEESGTLNMDNLRCLMIFMQEDML